MASSSKKRTTMAKMNRENAVREKRMRKAARKEARKLEDAPETLGDALKTLGDPLMDLPRFSGQFRIRVLASPLRGAWGAEPPSTKVLRKRVAGLDLASC